MRIDVLTLFPQMFRGSLSESILQRARRRKLLNIHFHNLREFGLGRHRQVDDRPYGGGAGMVMRVDVVVRAIEEVIEKGTDPSATRSGSEDHSGSRTTSSGPSGGTKGTDAFRPYRIYLSPKGQRLTQARIERLARRPWLLLLCGHYEGVDQRIIDTWIDEEVSIGDYVLTGGEIPAMVLIDAIARQVPDVLGREESKEEESFSRKLGRSKREYPHYTRPEQFRGLKVPRELVSGHHAEIERWRRRHLS